MQHRSVRGLPGGIQVGNTVTGSGPPLLLIHGAKPDHTLVYQFVPSMAAETIQAPERLASVEPVAPVVRRFLSGGLSPA